MSPLRRHMIDEMLEDVMALDASQLKTGVPGGYQFEIPGEPDGEPSPPPRPAPSMLPAAPLSGRCFTTANSAA
jgi:hypothetical protein